MLAPADHERLRENLTRIRERIAVACRSAGRDPDAVRLVAVSKYAGPDFARSLLALGQRDLGENRVGHLLELDAALADAEPRPRWHFIGHLQRNKATKVAGLLYALHSLDSAELARKLDAARPAGAEPLQVYLQLRLDPGEQRAGLDEDGLAALREQVSGLTRLRVVGLMGLPPLGEPEEARPHFARLAALRARLAGEELALSMGMTSDLEVAIAEGSTCVRVGRALLEGLSPAGAA